jgi:hypothetical protein
MAHLNGLTKLQLVAVGGTQVTDAGRSELLQALPRLWIRY